MHIISTNTAPPTQSKTNTQPINTHVYKRNLTKQHIHKKTFQGQTKIDTAYIYAITICMINLSKMFETNIAQRSQEFFLQYKNKYIFHGHDQDFVK